MTSHSQARVQTDKNSPQYIKRHGNKLFKQRNFKEAINQYTTALSHRLFTHDDDDVSLCTLLLKQSLYLMRGRAYFNVGKTYHAKKDFDCCINISDDTKYAYKAKLVRSMLNIDSIEYWKSCKRDLETITKVSVTLYST